MQTIYNPMSLVGKTILVTGASSGIGRAISIECSKLGAIVICTARNELRLRETLTMMEGEGHSFIIGDLEDSIFIDSLVAQLPKLDGVSHNAGMGLTMLTSFAKEEEIERLLKVNTLSPLILQSKILKKRKMKKNASLVFMSSISSDVSGYGNAFYAATKAALSAYVRTLAYELAPKGIRANTVHPGMIETSFIHTDHLGDEQHESFKQNYPLGRYGQPEEVAHIVAFLLSDASAWVTGSRYFIDGGRCTH